MEHCAGVLRMRRKPEFSEEEQKVDLWGSLWSDGQEGVSPRELQRNCTVCFATQEATERKLTGEHFLCRDIVEVETFVFKQPVREKKHF